VYAQQENLYWAREIDGLHGHLRHNNIVNDMAMVAKENSYYVKPTLTTKLATENSLISGQTKLLKPSY